MRQHVIFAAPFFLDATVRFIAGATHLAGVDLTLVSQDPLEQLPEELQRRLAGHWRLEDAMDPAQLVNAARGLSKRYGPVTHYFAALEQLQVPLAVARQALGIAGLSVEAARNFRDKSRMKEVLRNAGVPCARHALVGDPTAARTFIDTVGLPVVVKPPAGAGGKGTFRLEEAGDVADFLRRWRWDPESETLLEEFVRGAEHSFDSVFANSSMVWHSISRYLPAPLEVLENPWIQWAVHLPRQIAGQDFDPIRAAAERGLQALGLQTGLSHMEWFRLANGSIAISEVGARPPGAQITSLLSYAHDHDFYRAWPRLMVHGEFDCPARRWSVGAAYFRGQGKGRVSRITGLDEAQRRFGALVMESKLPREGQEQSGSYEGEGYVIVRHEDSGVVERALREIVSLVRVELA